MKDFIEELPLILIEASAILLFLGAIVLFCVGMR